MLEERDGGGITIVAYLYGLDLVSQMRNTATPKTHYFGYDGLGSVRYLTDGTPGSASLGEITDSYAYDAFGMLLLSHSSGGTLNWYRYTGEQYDSDLRLYYLRARYYNPQIGRFWTMDKKEGYREQPKSLHRYTYAEDDPVNNVDPSGEEIEGLLTVMNISTTLFAQISPATSKLSAMLSVPWGASRSLTSGEIELSRSIYDGNITYSKTGVDYGKWAWWQPKGREMTPDGIIHTGGVTIPDYSLPGGLAAAGFMQQKSTFIHEMCHVWQYQHGVNVLLRGLYRNYDYAGPNFGKLAFNDYGIEQQAQMTGDYYLLRNGYTSPTVPTPTPLLATYEKLLPFLPK